MMQHTGRFALAFLFGLAVLGANATTVTVTSLEDSGPGTLRQALLDAASGVCAAPCRIVIDRPDADSSIIVPKSPMPDIVADGTSIECAELYYCSLAGRDAGNR